MIRRRWLFALVVLILWGLATHGTHAGEGDEPHYLAIAHSLARDFDFDLSNNYGTDEPLVGGGGLRTEFHTREGRGGTLRPVHDVGLPILFAPFARFGLPLVSWVSRSVPPEALQRLRLQPATLYKHFVSAVMIPVAAWLAVLMFGALRSRGTPERAAFWWALLIALSPPLLVISISFFTEVVSAVLCLAAFSAITGDSRRPFTWLLAGAATGLLFLVHARNAGLIVGLVIVAAPAAAKQGKMEGLTPFAWFAGAFAVLLAFRTAITYRFWGTWLTSPHARTGEWAGAEGFVTEIGRRAAGLLLDQEYGLLPYAPIFALAPVGLVLLARRDRELARNIVLVAGAYLALILLPITNAHGWTGGWSPAGRFWVPIVPLLAYPIAAAAAGLPRAVTATLIVLQLVINGYLWQHPKSNWNDGDGTAAVCARTGAGFCEYLPSFVTAQEQQRPTQ